MGRRIGFVFALGEFPHTNSGCKQPLSLCINRRRRHNEGVMSSGARGGYLPMLDSELIIRCAERSDFTLIEKRQQGPETGKSIPKPGPRLNTGFSKGGGFERTKRADKIRRAPALMAIFSLENRWGGYRLL
jgi:hypothetical protein